MCRKVANDIRVNRVDRGWGFPCEAEPYDVGGEAITRIHDEVRTFVPTEYDGPHLQTGNNERRTAEIIQMVRLHAEGPVFPESAIKETVATVVADWRDGCDEELKRKTSLASV